MKILAIHAQTHDTSVVGIKNNQIEYAVGNERFSRIKMDRGIPLKALDNYFKFTNTKPKDLDEVIFIGSKIPWGVLKHLKENTSWLIDTKGKYLFTLVKKPHKLILELLLLTGIPRYSYREVFPQLIIKKRLDGFKGKISYVHHHLAHLYSAYFASGWKECLVACLEGSGFNEAVSIYYVKDDKWQRLSQSRLPHSAGVVYGVATMLLGFKAYKHAGKVTGLAAYGNPKKLRSLVKKIMWVEDMNIKVDSKMLMKWIIDYREEKKVPKQIAQTSKEDVAAAFQERLEQCVLEIVEKALKKSGATRIALAGGVAANVKLNQKIHELPQVREIFIQPAMGDEGLALGAALFAANKAGIKVKRLENLYLGPKFSDSEILKSIKKFKVINYKRPKSIEKIVAKLLSEGKIIARCCGRMELGPRALGNRSILYQTTDPSVNKWLNEKLKRSEFMPFAPVTLEEFADKCYKNIKGAEYTAKFMTLTFDCTEYMKKTSPACVHIDGTARPQLISKKDNPSYYKILKEYYKQTGIPSLVNTSFNMHEEPIVCTPDDAIRAFQQGELDYLMLNNYLISKD
jgi:carbamoyltransferase